MAPTPNITPIAIPAFVPVFIALACEMADWEGTAVTVATGCTPTKPGGVVWLGMLLEDIDVELGMLLVDIAVDVAAEVVETAASANVFAGIDAPEVGRDTNVTPTGSLTPPATRAVARAAWHATGNELTAGASFAITYV